jgi:F-type H+-transporting ATPase subunit b
MPLTVVLAGSVVDLDATVVVQLLCFLVLFLVLRPLLFRPLMAVLNEREKATEGDVREARRRQTEAEEKMRKYERELERTREKASAEREKIREIGRAREREILDKARHEVDAAVAGSRSTMVEQAAAVRRDMEREIDVLAREISAAVLGRGKAA